MKKEPSDRAIAAGSGVCRDTVRHARMGKKLTPLVRYRLELAGLLKPQERPPLAEAILRFCVTADISLRELERRADIRRSGLVDIRRRGSADRSTLAKLALVMGRRAEDLEELCVPGRYGHAQRMAAGLFAAEVRVRRVPQVEAIVSRVLERHPEADAEAIRRDIQRLTSKRRGRGAPRTFTDDQAREVRRLRDEGGLSWPKIGRRMGWSVQRDRYGRPSDCRKARRAYAHA